MLKRNLTPARVLILGYVSLTMIGTALLSLPLSSTATAGRASVVDAYYTTTSALCVTGLIVRDTEYDFSPFGKAVILLLIQTGGLGYMTLATSFALVLRRRISLKGKLTQVEGLGQFTYEGMAGFAIKILIVTVVLEGAGTAILATRFAMTGIPAGHSIGYGVFHSVSAFCNAGFSLFSRNLVDYVGDPVVSLTVAGLLISGGLGFVVIRDIYRRLVKRNIKRLSEHTKIALVMTALLLAVGSAGIFTLEYTRALSNLPLPTKLLASFFQSATPRTAGYNTVDIGALAPATLYLMTILMFIGASPGGTGGGIKTTTFAIGGMKLYAILSGKGDVSAFGRRISDATIMRGLVLMLAVLVIVAVGTGLLLVSEQEPVRVKGLLGVLFEDVSAFGTVGLSMGSYTRPTTSLSHDFTAFGKIVIGITMLAGKTGPLTLGAAVALRQRRAHFTYPEGRVLIV